MDPRAHEKPPSLNSKTVIYARARGGDGLENSIYRGPAQPILGGLGPCRVALANGT